MGGSGQGGVCHTRGGCGMCCTHFQDTASLLGEPHVQRQRVHCVQASRTLTAARPAWLMQNSPWPSRGKSSKVEIITSWERDSSIGNLMDTHGHS